MGIQRELHVAAALDLQLANDLQRRIAQQLVFLVGQRLARGHHHAVAGVHAHGVDVFHVADSDGGVVGVAHHLVLDLLVALDGLLHQHLMHGRDLQRVLDDLAQLVLIVGKAATGATQRECGANDHRIGDGVGRVDRLVHGGGDHAGQHRLAQLFAELLEQLAILSPLDGLGRRAQDFHLTLVQHALLGQLHGQRQSGLAAQSGHDGVGALIAQNLRHVLQRQRLHVHLVGDVRIRHDGGRVGVHENDLVSLLLQRQAGLRARVVKLRRLTDDDRAGANHQYFLYIRSLRHDFSSIIHFRGHQKSSRWNSISAGWAQGYPSRSHRQYGHRFPPTPASSSSFRNRSNR